MHWCILTSYKFPIYSTHSEATEETSNDVLDTTVIIGGVAGALLFLLLLIIITVAFVALIYKAVKKKNIPYFMNDLTR